MDTFLAVHWPSICGADGRWQTAGRLPFLDPRRGLLLGGLGHFLEETTNHSYGHLSVITGDFYGIIHSINGVTC